MFLLAVYVLDNNVHTLAIDKNNGKDQVAAHFDEY